MADDRYRVVSLGRVRDGQDPARAKDNVARLFKTSTAKVAPLFAGRKSVVRKGLDKAGAERYREALIRAGLVCCVEPETPTAPAPAGDGRDACPACGHGPISGPDCPRCGIVIEKYLAKRNLSAPPTADDAVAGPQMVAPAGPPTGVSEGERGEYWNNLPEAALGRRALAGLCTFFSITLILNLLRVPLAMIISAWHGKMFDVDPSLAEHAGYLAEVARMNREYALVLVVLELLLALLICVILPLRGRRTWGQAVTRTQVLHEDTGLDLTLGTWATRLVGSALVPLTFGLAGLVPLIRKDHRSLADVFSGTRQVARTKADGVMVLAALLPLILGLVLAWPIMNFTRGLMNPQERLAAGPTDIAALGGAGRSRDATASQVQMLEVICTWEDKMMAETGSYTPYLDELLSAHGQRSGSGLVFMRIVDAQMRGILLLKTTEEGFAVGYKLPGDAGYRVFTQDGDQGVQPEW